ncbi:MAG TPA: hypothetical protein VGC62_10220 [Pseudomonas sp.]|uniref:hypothetical protein n=1 Tax=Pseudomonas sp. TaxID=306 RepID=UPI002ED9C57B
MKTTIAFIVTLMLAAISASALAMPCSQNSRTTEEARDSQHQIRLHVAQQSLSTAPSATLHSSPAPFKAHGQIIRLPV